MTTAYVKGRPISLPQLPEMRCDTGCGACCGPVNVSPQEYARIARVVEARGLHPRAQGLSCPLYIDGGCSIYEARPLVCRVFGHGLAGHKTGNLTGCVKGYDVAGSAAALDLWQGAMEKDLDSGYHASVMLHELVYTNSEINAMLADASAKLPPGNQAQVMLDLRTA